MGVILECFLEEKMNEQDLDHASALKGEPWPPCLLSHIHATLDVVQLPGGLSSPTFRGSSEQAPLTPYEGRLLFCVGSSARIQSSRPQLPAAPNRELTWNPQKKSSQLCPYLGPLYKLAFGEYSLSGRHCSEQPLGSCASRGDWSIGGAP